MVNVTHALAALVLLASPAASATLEDPTAPRFAIGLRVLGFQEDTRVYRLDEYAGLDDEPLFLARNWQREAVFRAGEDLCMSKGKVGEFVPCDGETALAVELPGVPQEAIPPGRAAFPPVRSAAVARTELGQSLGRPSGGHGITPGGPGGGWPHKPEPPPEWPFWPDRPDPPPPPVPPSPSPVPLAGAGQMMASGAGGLYPSDECGLSVL